MKILLALLLLIPSVSWANHGGGIGKLNDSKIVNYINEAHEPVDDMFKINTAVDDCINANKSKVKELEIDTSKWMKEMKLWGNSYNKDWHLNTCGHVPSNSSSDLGKLYYKCFTLSRDVNKLGAAVVEGLKILKEMKNFCRVIVSDLDDGLTFLNETEETIPETIVNNAPDDTESSDCIVWNKKVLKGKNLIGCFLVKKDLLEANLSDANLEGANLKGADLTGANLSDANLKGADLTGADLSRANLSDANLEGANLKGAKLTGANLEGADLTDTDLSDINLYGASLRGAFLIDADISDTNFRGAKLKGAIWVDGSICGKKSTGKCRPN